MWAPQLRSPDPQACNLAVSTQEMAFTLSLNCKRYICPPPKNHQRCQKEKGELVTNILVKILF